MTMWDREFHTEGPPEFLKQIGMFKKQRGDAVARPQRAGEVEEGEETRRGRGPDRARPHGKGLGCYWTYDENVEHSKQGDLIYALESSLCFMEDELKSVLAVWEPHRRLLDCRVVRPNGVLDTRGESSPLEEKTGESLASKG